MKKLIIKSIGLYFNILSYTNKKRLQKKGFEMFCNPFSKKVRPHQLQFLETASLFDFEFHGNKIQGYKWGSGSKKVLLMHGWASNTFRWKKLIEKLLKADYTVYAFDAPAHGLSEGKILNVVIYEECLTQFLKTIGFVDRVVAHSIGGFTLIYHLYLNKKNQFEKVVIMGAPGCADDFFTFYQKALSLTKRTTNLIIDQFSKELGRHPSFFSSVKFAPEIDTNIYLIHDKDDQDASYTYSENLSKLLKNNTLELTQGLGHNLKSAEIDKKIIDFLD